MKYFLMHRDVPVAEIETVDGTSTILSDIIVINTDHIPVGVKYSDDSVNRSDLNVWWESRLIPRNRQDYEFTMQKLSIASFESITNKTLTIKCYGLSLSDQYWMNPSDNPLEWNKINFFDNDFSEDIGIILFGGKPESGNIDFMSPDITTDGWLRKRWDIKRRLIKGGSNPFWQEPLNEVLSAAIMRRLKIPHVDYTLIFEGNEPYSVCDNFITRDTELVSAKYILGAKNYTDSRQSFYSHFLDCCGTLGIPNAKENIDKMIVVDYLIANTDRHASNFGAVRNAKTLEWIGIAPIFDSGTSFWHDRITEKINDVSENRSKTFETTHEEQIKLVTDFSWLDLSALDGIEDEFMNIHALSPLINEERRTQLLRAFRQRIDCLKQYVCK